AMTITLFEDLMFSADIRTISFAAVLCAAFGYFAYRAKTIDISGVFASVLFGIILIIFANVMWFFVVLMFFIAGSIFTKYKYDKKRRMGVEQRKSGRRGYKNAFANVGVAVAASILYGISGGNVIFSALFVGSLATATADTLASEIGVTSSKPPRMITNFKVCRPGTNGGVTLAGEAASLIGSFVISAASFMMGICPLYVAVICVFIGFIGNNLDSLYGALIENKGIIGNSGTNLLATLSGGLAALGITAALISLNLV
ncbi:MAG TPA: DUF92 domain-containing protein, partial [Methanocorpusculum sp.]|nr:DUF92 domain-containing protein [Methanocorpusculum sp.]